MPIPKPVALKTVEANSIANMTTIASSHPKIHQMLATALISTNMLDEIIIVRAA